MTDFDRDLHDENLSRLYKAGQKVEPPGHLDQKILAAARRSTKRSIRSPFMSITATAAVILLSVGVVMNVLLEAPLQEKAFEPEPMAPMMDRVDKIQVQGFAIDAPPVVPAPAQTRQSAPAMATVREEKAKFVQEERVRQSRQKSVSAMPDCRTVNLPDSEDPLVWTERANKAQGVELWCLKRAYEEHFKQPLLPE